MKGGEFEEVIDKGVETIGPGQPQIVLVPAYPEVERSADLAHVVVTAVHAGVPGLECGLDETTGGAMVVSCAREFGQHSPPAVVQLLLPLADVGEEVALEEVDGGEPSPAVVHRLNIYQARLATEAGRSMLGFLPGSVSCVP
ncbi:hypothetical protein [Planomonospora alba]|uniref:hypothetical protein n=1 Tax=Planomonospora alba TaxID=161354 RepID=UPI0031EE840A